MCVRLLLHLFAHSKSSIVVLSKFVLKKHSQPASQPYIFAQQICDFECPFYFVRTASEQYARLRSAWMKLDQCYLAHTAYTYVSHLHKPNPPDRRALACNGRSVMRLRGVRSANNRQCAHGAPRTMFVCVCVRSFDRFIFRIYYVRLGCVCVGVCITSHFMLTLAGASAGAAHKCFIICSDMQ